MYTSVITSNAQNSPPGLVCPKFSQTSGTVLLHMGILLIFAALKICSCRSHGLLVHDKFKICIFKARLGGEIY